MKKKRRPMKKRESRRVFKKGNRVKAKNANTTPMRGGIRL